MMAEEKKLQEEELHQVSGGADVYDTVLEKTCTACGYTFEPSEANGTKILEDNGCGKRCTIRYKCPRCGNTWQP